MAILVGHECALGFCMTETALLQPFLLLVDEHIDSSNWSDWQWLVVLLYFLGDIDCYIGKVKPSWNVFFTGKLKGMCLLVRNM